MYNELQIPPSGGGSGGGGSSPPGGAPPVLTQNLKVAGNNVGGASIGDEFLAGDLQETVLRKILVEAIPYNYRAPTLSLSNALTKNVEVGKNIVNPFFSASFNQLDGGATDGALRMYKDGGLINTYAPLYTIDSFQVGAGGIRFHAEQDYLEGPERTNNVGEPSPNGRIGEGTAVSNNVYFNGYRNAFFGAGVNLLSGDSNAIRSLPGGTHFNPGNGTSFTVPIPTNSNTVVFAYPASLPTVSLVIYPKGSNAEVQDTFTEKIIQVAGLNDHLPIDYKVYTYFTPEPFDQDVSYIVTI